jgi:hypothetical protein
LRYIPVARLCEPRYDSTGVLLREVWKYRDVASERDVAVKLIPTAGQGEFVAQVERDGAALTADVPGVAVLLDHQLLDAGTPLARLALISQFVTGSQLDEFETEDPERVVRLARSLATSVAALHAAGVVHGDIKPSNVIVRASDGQPVLVDAGSARRPGQRLLASSRLWEPPEAGTDPKATREYDCWSLGLVLATLLGFQPVSDETPEARGRRASAEVGERPGSPSAILASVVPTLLKSSPATRASAAAVVDALEAKPPRSWSQMHRRLIAGALVAIIVVVAGVAIAARSSGGHASAAPPLVVSNKLVFGATGVREDTTPAALSTIHKIRCQKLGCNVPGTQRHTGGTLPAPVCQAQGDEVTNGSLSDPSDDHNPRLVTSYRWYGVPDPKTPANLDYISEVWVRPDQRGGLGLPTCAAWLAKHG